MVGGAATRGYVGVPWLATGVEHSPACITYRTRGENNK
jgi:hypothetical protein